MILIIPDSFLIYCTPRHPRKDTNEMMPPNRAEIMHQPRKKLGSRVPQSEQRMKIEMETIVIERTKKTKFMFRAEFFIK